jgi:hypothetical protein
MSHSLNYNSQQINKTFGTVKQNLYSSDYIANKKAKTMYCNATTISKPTFSSIVISNDKQINSQENLKLFQNATLLKQQSSSVCVQYPFNTANLNINLYTTTDLNGVNTFKLTPSSAASPPNPNNILPTNYPLYEFYTLDPNGSLFGNTACFKRNFLNYWVPNESSQC